MFLLVHVAWRGTDSPERELSQLRSAFLTWGEFGERGLEVSRAELPFSVEVDLCRIAPVDGGISKRCGKVKGDVTIPSDLEVWDGLEPVPGKARRHEEGYAGAGHVVEGGIRGS